MYSKFWKRFMDLALSLCALLCLSPLLLILAAAGVIAMRGNPFFTQERPGRNGKIFKLVKFRSMDNRKDADGKLLPDDIRLNRYGRFLRSTSADELPELLNILVGDMSLVGPRPLLVEYLPYYTPEENRRHDVRPGLTGWAQVNGRNATDWDTRLQQDVYYVDHCSFGLDCKIVYMTVLKVVKRSDILVGKQIKAGRLDTARKAKENQESAEMK